MGGYRRAEVANLTRERTETIMPARQAAAEVLRAERRLSDLVNQAYGLAPGALAGEVLAQGGNDSLGHARNVRQLRKLRVQLDDSPANPAEPPGPPSQNEPDPPLTHPRNPSYQLPAGNIRPS